MSALATMALVLLGALSGLGMGSAARGAARSDPSSAVYRILRAVERAFRLTLVLTAAAAFAPCVASRNGRIDPWWLLALALVLGWGARGLVADALGRIALFVDRSVQPGQWIEVGSHVGCVLRVGWRALWIQDTSGRHRAIALRYLLGEPVAVGLVVSVLRVRIDRALSRPEARRALVEAALQLPWRITEDVPRLSEIDPATWQVHVRLVSPSFAAHAQGWLEERIQPNEAEARVKEKAPSKDGSGGIPKA